MLDDNDQRIVSEMRVSLAMASEYIMELSERLDEVEGQEELDCSVLYPEIFKAHAPLCRMCHTHRTALAVVSSSGRTDPPDSVEKACLPELNERYHDHGGEYNDFEFAG